MKGIKTTGYRENEPFLTEISNKSAKVANEPH